MRQFRNISIQKKMMYSMLAFTLIPIILVAAVATSITYITMRNQLIYDHRMSSGWLQDRLSLELNGMMDQFYEFEVNNNFNGLKLNFTNTYYAFFHSIVLERTDDNNNPGYVDGSDTIKTPSPHTLTAIWTPNQVNVTAQNISGTDIEGTISQGVPYTYYSGSVEKSGTVNTNRMDVAEKCFRAAAELDPENPGYKRNLQFVQSRLSGPSAQ